MALSRCAQCGVELASREETRRIRCYCATTEQSFCLSHPELKLRVLFYGTEELSESEQRQRLVDSRYDGDRLVYDNESGLNLCRGDGRPNVKVDIAVWEISHHHNTLMIVLEEKESQNPVYCLVERDSEEAMRHFF